MGKIINLRSIPRPVDWSSRQEKIDKRTKELLEKRAALEKKAKDLFRKD